MTPSGTTTAARLPQAGMPVQTRPIGMVAAKEHPDRSRLIWATRCVLAVQVGATVVAIALAVPDFIDRLTRPSSCIPGCMDLRGFVFIVLLILLTPALLALTVAVLLLRRGRMWPCWLALVVNLLVVGCMAFGVLQLITGSGSCSDMCQSFDYGHVPLLLEQIQVVLLAAPPLASLAVLFVLLSRSLAGATRVGRRAYL